MDFIYPDGSLSQIIQYQGGHAMIL